MPLTDLQRTVVAILRPFRTDHNYAGGGAALNYEWPRLSDDMDIFHDNRHQLPHSVEPELEALRQAGFSTEITTDDRWMVEVILRRHGFETKVQWLDEPETSKRFFPALEDDAFGFRLHQADVAVNKVLCASRRRTAPRDAVDLVNITRRYSPLGPLVWAAVGKAPDMAPPEVIRNIRNVVFGYSDEEIQAVRLEDGNTITRIELREILEFALAAAREYCDEMAPIDYVGCLFVDAAEIPIEADDEAIARNSAKAIPVKDFSIAPIIKN